VGPVTCQHPGYQIDNGQIVAQSSNATTSPAAAPEQQICALLATLGIGRPAARIRQGPGTIAAKILTHRDGHGSELVCPEPECLVGGHNRDSIQKRAPVPLGRFIPICVE
jgi:hypothetical protein